MRAQVSVEYLIVVGIGLLLLTPVILYATSLLFSSKKELRIELAEDAVESLAEAADWVYSLGPPSRMELTIYIPEKVNETLIENHTILMKLEDYPSPISTTTKANVTGNIPVENGYYKVLVIAEENCVNISVVE